MSDFFKKIEKKVLTLSGTSDIIIELAARTAGKKANRFQIKKTFLKKQKKHLTK